MQTYSRCNNVSNPIHQVGTSNILYINIHIIIVRVTTYKYARLALTFLLFFCCCLAVLCAVLCVGIIRLNAISRTNGTLSIFSRQQTDENKYSAVEYFIFLCSKSLMVLL